MNPQIETALRGLLVLIGTTVLVKRNILSDAELQQYLGYAFILAPVLWAQIASFARTHNIKILQSHLGVKTDGKVGPVTIDAAKNTPQ